MEGEPGRVLRPALRELLRVLGGVLFFSVFLTNPDRAVAETPTECAKRLEALVGADLVEKKGDQLYVPVEILRRYPLFFRNLIVQVYSQPFLAPFFQGFEKAARSLHHAPRGLEFRRIIAELDRQQSYSFEDVLESLRTILGDEDSSAFELDISRIEKDGIYLNFVQAPVGQNDVRLRFSFARAWIRKVAAQKSPLPVRALTYKSSDTVYLVESAFYLSEIYENVRRYVVDELLLPWAQFEDFFKHRYKTASLKLTLPSESGEDKKVTLTFSRRLKAGASVVYELTSSHEVVFEGVTLINGNTVTWERTASGQFVGFVAATGQGTLNLSWTSLMGTASAEFSF